MITYDWNLGTKAFPIVDLRAWCNRRRSLSPKAYDEQQETLATAALVTRTETEPFAKATQMLNAQRKNAIYSTSQSWSTTLPYFKLLCDGSNAHSQLPYKCVFLEDVKTYLQEPGPHVVLITSCFSFFVVFNAGIRSKAFLLNMHAYIAQRVTVW